MNKRLALAAIAALAFSACGSDTQTESSPDTGAASPPTSSSDTVETPPPASLSDTVATPSPESLPPETSPAGTVAESTPASSTSALPQTSVDEIVTSDVPTDRAEALRLDDGASIYGVAVLDEVDVQATIASISEGLGDPTSATEWSPMPEPLSSLGVLEYSEVWWSDLRVVFERTDGSASLSGWSLGALPSDGCFPPSSTEPTGTSMLTTADSIGIGSEIDTLADQYFLVNQTESGAAIANVNPIAIAVEEGQVSGISQARADCFSGDEL